MTRVVVLAQRRDVGVGKPDLAGCKEDAVFELRGDAGPKAFLIPSVRDDHALGALVVGRVAVAQSERCARWLEQRLREAVLVQPSLPEQHGETEGLPVVAVDLRRPAAGGDPAVA